MKDTQKEMTEFFESYATTEDEDVENELEELANQLEGESAKELPEVSTKQVTKKEEVKPVTVQKQKVDEDALNDFLAG